jgi:hypothetical protein
MSMPHVAHALRQDSRETYEVYETPERARAQALRSAGEGRLGDALTALTSAWSAERNRALDDDAADIAAIHLANGREDRALAALEVGIRGRRNIGPRARATLADCVLSQPGLIGEALAIAGAAGSYRDRALVVWAVLRTRLDTAGRFDD